MSCREVGGRTWPYVHRAKYASVKERRMAGGVKGQSPFLSRGRACAAGGQSTTAQGPLDIPRWLKSPFFPGANGDGWGKLSGDKTAFKGKRPLEVQK